DLAVLLGANPASNHPRMMTQLADLRKRGGKVIVVNPVRESGLEKFHVPSNVISLFFGTDIASLYVQPLAGGDVGLLVGVLKALVDTGKINRDFLDKYTQGSQAVIAYAEQTTWEDIVGNSGVEHKEIEAMAAMIASASNVVFCWAMGLTHHTHGVDNV